MSRLLGSRNFGFSKASLHFRLYDPLCLHKIRLLKKRLILKLADGRAIISVVESAEYESQRLAREDMTPRKRITTLI